MKTTNTLSILLILLLIACKKKETPDSLNMVFFPRKCNYMWVITSENVKMTSPAGDYFELGKISPDQSVKAENLRLIIHTSNIDTLFVNFFDHVSLALTPYDFHQNESLKHLWDLDPRNPILEDQLKRDFQFKKNETKSSASDLEAIHIFNWEYRTTGIEEFKITANKKIFGQEPGSNLNDYFEIVALEPTQIISSERKELVYGYSDWNGRMSIAQWLDFKPMAQPTMILKLNTIPAEMPIDVEFAVLIKSNNKTIVSTALQTLLIP
jgi:hypothetical protein